MLRRILLGEIHLAINPNPYRGIFDSDPIGYARDVQDQIDYGTSGKVAGFISETIQEASIVVLRLKSVIPDTIIMAKVFEISSP
ncbi:hypothetical protein SADUNF_Sadunf05G0055400 [Salix dunnii]|uniref:Uncharacterized protein n=1 Tax=Salix dunnii TaxID=1413687 RepID=A0A835K3V3_9ROSI|nr:hypothetical protein SADUNF_Sadunf05G0055400 [Salix dunnii]